MRGDTVFGDLDALRAGVDPERLYKTVYEIQGVKHPVTAPEALDGCADRIARDMRACGLEVFEQLFRIDGWEHPFRNIEGTVGDVGREPATVIVAHYDTVPTSWGANDDAIGIAVMLETARLIARIDNPPPVRFVAVTLEESSNPVIYRTEQEALLRLGIRDRDHFFTGWRISREYARVWARAQAAYDEGLSYGSGLRAFLEEEPGLLPNIREYVETILPLYDGIDAPAALGYKSRIGSFQWVREALSVGKRISSAIALDECGTFSREPLSQGMFRGVDPFEAAAESHRLDAEKRTGDFIMILSDEESADPAARLFRACAAEGVDLPAARRVLPASFAEALRSGGAGYGSDHASFRAFGIPAILVYDTSSGRNPFVHSMADLSDELDYDRAADLTKALITFLCSGEAHSAGGAL